MHFHHSFCFIYLSIKKRQFPPILTSTCQNYYLGMNSTSLNQPQPTRKNSSLPNKIKIRTCRLPKDFFQRSGLSLEKTRSGCESRRSTCDEEDSHPCTPSFKNILQQAAQNSHLSRKAETARVVSFNLAPRISPQRQKPQSIKRRLSRQIHQKFPILTLPPIGSSKIFLDL